MDESIALCVNVIECVKMNEEVFFLIPFLLGKFYADYFAAIGCRVALVSVMMMIFTCGLVMYGIGCNR